MESIASGANISNELRLSIWEGKIAIKIHFDTRDMVNLPSSPPELAFEDYFGLLPRCGYFSFFIKDFVSFIFREILDAPGFSWGEIWLDYLGLPLKWHFPIGQLYDLFIKAESAPEQKAWEINLRYGAYPADKLFRGFQPTPANPLPSSDFFMALNKESNYIRHGNAKKIMNLSKDDQTQLWDSLVNNNFKRFWEIQNRLNGYDSLSDLKLENERFVVDLKCAEKSELPRNVPIRIYVQELTSMEAQDLEYPLPIQDLVPPLYKAPETEDDCNSEASSFSLTTLLDAIKMIVFPGGIETSFTLISHGISLSPHTPLLWAYLHFMYPDGFLHLLIKETR